MTDDKKLPPYGAEFLRQSVVDSGPERRALAKQKARLKRRRSVTDWPLDADTLEKSERVDPEDVMAPPLPEPPKIEFYKAEAAKTARMVDSPLGLVQLDPNLQIFRRSQFEQELSVTASKRAPAWTADHADQRLVEAFKILFRIAAKVGPRAFGSAMPKAVLEFADLAAQAENRSLRKTMGRLLRNFGPPTADEHRRMEEALAWPIEYLADCSRDVKMFVNLGAMWKASNASISDKCRDLGVHRQTFYRDRKIGLQVIVQGLISTGKAPL